MDRTEHELPLIGGKADGQRVTLAPDQPTPPFQVVGGEIYKLFAMQGQERVYYAYNLDGMDPDTVLMKLFSWYLRPSNDALAAILALVYACEKMAKWISEGQLAITPNVLSDLEAAAKKGREVL